LFGAALVCSGVFLAALALIPNIVMAVLLAAGLGACGGVAWVTGYTLLGLAVDDEVRGRTFGFLTSSARVVLVLVLAAAPALAGLIGKHRVRFTDSFSLDYNGAAFVFLVAAVIALVMGVTAYRQMDDRPGSSLVADLRESWAARRDHPKVAANRAHAGVFIAFEGGDGTGKSTQARLLAEWLEAEEGHEAVLTREPGGTALGATLREVLLGHGSALTARTEALLFAADRAQHVAAVVRPAVARGAVVVTDRYIDSSVAYQGSGRELGGDDIARLSRWATEGLTPDLTVLLDLDPVLSKARRARDAGRDGDDGLESLPDDFHARVRDRFLDLARREPHRYLVLDAGEPVDEIQQRVRQRVRQILPVSARRRQLLRQRLVAEEEARQRRASAEAEVHRIDAELRGRGLEEARARQRSQRRAKEEAERQLAEEETRVD
jgi:dTMP kinase